MELNERKNRRCRIFVHSKAVFLENIKPIGTAKGVQFILACAFRVKRATLCYQDRAVNTNSYVRYNLEV